MQREEAVEKLGQLLGKDLRVLAGELQVTVWKKTGKKNKGWAGHVIERYLGLPPRLPRRQVQQDPATPT